MRRTYGSALDFSGDDIERLVQVNLYSVHA